MTKQKPFEVPFSVEAGGPFKSKFEGVLRAGVNLARGINGAGKSFLGRMLVRMSKSRLAIGDFTVNDDLTGATATYTLGSCRVQVRHGKKPQRFGEDTLVPTEGLPEPIRVLVDPQMKGDRPALKARLKAILIWTGIEATEEILREVLGPDDEIAGLLGTVVSPEGDLMDLVEEARKEIHARRRQAEEEYDDLISQLDRIEGEKGSVLGEYDEEEVAEIEPDVEAARSALETSRAAAAELALLRRTRLEETERRTELAESMGERPDAEELETRLEQRAEEAEAAKASLMEREAEVEKAEEALREAEARLRDAEEAGRAAQADHDRAAERYQDAVAEHGNVQRAQERWDEQKARLDEPLEIPEEEEVEAAQKAVEAAEEAVALHKTAERFHQVAARAVAVRDEAILHEARIKFLEGEADAVWDRLAGAVNERLDSEVIRVEGNAVEISVDGSWIDIADSERVSEGQVHSVCYDLLLAHRRGQRIIVIEGSTAVDPQHLAELGTKARAQDTLLYMETPVDAEEKKGLWIEHYPDGSQGEVS